MEREMFHDQLPLGALCIISISAGVSGIFIIGIIFIFRNSVDLLYF